MLIVLAQHHNVLVILTVCAVCGVVTQDKAILFNIPQGVVLSSQGVRMKQTTMVRICSLFL